MPKLGFFAAVTSIIAGLTFATLSSPANADDAAAGPCVRTEFKTELVK